MDIKRLCGIKNKKLMIIGASGHGKVVSEVAKSFYDIIDYLDDNNQKAIGKVCDFKKYIDEYDFIVAIGNNEIRERITQCLLEFNANVVNVISAFSYISSDLKLGVGNVVMPGCIIQPGCVIGDGVIVNTSATIDHENIIGSYAHISVGSHLAGNVHIGKRTFVGVGTNIINNIEVTGDCVIGAGSTVLSNIIENGTYVGTPAKKIK